jgi:hypothetical protein
MGFRPAPAWMDARARATPEGPCRSVLVPDCGEALSACPASRDQRAARAPPPGAQSAWAWVPVPELPVRPEGAVRPGARADAPCGKLKGSAKTAGTAGTAGIEMNIMICINVLTDLSCPRSLEGKRGQAGTDSGDKRGQAPLRDSGDGSPRPCRRSPGTAGDRSWAGPRVGSSLSRFDPLPTLRRPMHGDPAPASADRGA